MIERRPIFVTGAPRSGKSIIAEVLRICGVYGGDVNKMGENISVNERLLRPFLQTHQTEIDASVPSTNELLIPKNWGEKVSDIFIRDGYTGGDWYYKSSGICATWPVWSAAFPEAKYIVIRRRIGDIVTSCLSTDYVGSGLNREDWVKIIREYEGKMSEMISEGLNCKIIWPHRMVTGDYQQIYEMLDWLGLPWRTEILATIDPKFWKIRKKTKL